MIDSEKGSGGDVMDEEEKEHPWEKEDLAQHHKDERLFDSVVANDLNLVKVSLKVGAHHHHHKNGYTPLMVSRRLFLLLLLKTSSTSFFFFLLASLWIYLIRRCA